MSYILFLTIPYEIVDRILGQSRCGVVTASEQILYSGMANRVQIGKQCAFVAKNKLDNIYFILELT